MTRSIPWTQVLPMLAVASVPALWTAAVGDGTGDQTLVLWLLVAAGTTAFALDEPDRAITDSTATDLARRVGRRLGMLVVAALGAGVIVATLAGFDVSVAAARSHLPAVAAALTLSVAMAAALRRRGAARVSVSDATAGPLAVIVVSAMALRYPWLPSLTDPHSMDRWWWVASAAAGGAGWSLRDPYRNAPVGSPVEL